MTLRTFEEMFVINEPIRKFIFFTLIWKIFIFMQHEFNYAIAALICA